MKGKVKFFDEKKGFGFILGVDGKDAFVHFSSILSEQRYKNLQADAEVSYDIEHSEKGLVAKNVKVEI